MTGEKCAYVFTSISFLSPYPCLYSLSTCAHMSIAYIRTCVSPYMRIFNVCMPVHSRRLGFARRGGFQRRVRREIRLEKGDVAGRPGGRRNVHFPNLVWSGVVFPTLEPVVPLDGRHPNGIRATGERKRDAPAGRWWLLSSYNQNVTRDGAGL